MRSEGIEQPEKLEQGSWLIQAIAGALSIDATLNNEHYRPQPSLMKVFGGPLYLGRGGYAVLLLRDVMGAQKWHESACLDSGTPTVRKALPAGPVAPLRYPLVERENKAQRLELEAWWDEQRSRPDLAQTFCSDPVLEGAAASKRACQRGASSEEDAYFAEPDGTFTRANPEFVPRFQELRGLVRRQPVNRTGRLAGNLKFTSAWTAWRDDAQGRLAIEFESEPNGLITGVLLFQAGEEADVDFLFDLALALAWEMARLAVRQYWMVLAQTQSAALVRRFINSALHIDPSKGDLHHTDILPRIGRELRALIGAVGNALHTPVVGLFVPDTAGNVGLISQVGYDTLEPLCFSSTGLIQTLCLHLEPAEGACFQVSTEEGWQRLWRDLGLHPEPPLPHQAFEAGSPYETHRHLLPELVQEERGPRVLRGPWAFGRIALEPTFWPPSEALSTSPPRGFQPKTGQRPTAILEVMGRVPHRLDRPGQSPPFHAHELAMMAEWSSQIAYAFQNLVRACVRSLESTLLRLRPSHVDVRSLQRALDSARRELRADWLFVYRQTEDGRLEQEMLSRHSAAPNLPELLNSVMTDMLQQCLGDQQPRRFEHLDMGVRCLPIGKDGVLVLVGVAPELPIPGRARTVSRFLDSSLTMLAALLVFALSLHRPVSVKAPQEVREAWRRLYDARFTPDGSTPGVPHDEREWRLRMSTDQLGGLIQWLGEAFDLFDGSALDFREWLDISKSMLDRVLSALRESHLNAPPSWRRIERRETSKTRQELGQELVLLVPGDLAHRPS